MPRSAVHCSLFLLLAAPYASAQLSSSGSQIWSQASPGIAGAQEAGDRVGESLATGDFNNDGFDDLAIGVPRESVGTEDAAGAVNVIYGGANGLTPTGNQLWTQNSESIDGEAEAQDLFGGALAACDFNGDSFDDLAVGASGENSTIGSVQILYGAPGGLGAAGNQVWSQSVPGIEGVPEVRDGFGSALACSDIDADGYSDLAIGVPDESVGEVGFAGVVNVIYGTASGLSAQGAQIFSRNILGIGGFAEASDLFGFSLAFGDFNNDRYADLALGMPGEDFGENTDVGEAIILVGTAEGLTIDGVSRVRQGFIFVGGAAEQGDLFGFALTAADFNNDGFDDLAIGASGDVISGLASAGAVNVVFGSAVA